ncbi:MAG: T9SS type A sorting domain-containing protein [Ferruginibacter sp.]
MNNRPTIRFFYAINSNAIKQLLFTIAFLLAGKMIFAQALSLTVSQVAGNCVSNAQVNATASGGTLPYQFRLTAGAAGSTYPTAWQSSTNFPGLRAGTYTVQVQDNLGAVAGRNINVTTTYTSLAITTVAVKNNYCPLSPDGRITITATAGKTPYIYELLQGSTTVAGPQNNNVFNNLTEGNYTVQVTDACGEIRTYNSTLLLTDFKWKDVKNSDVDFIVTGAGQNKAAAPFDTTKSSNIHDGPILFTCDSVTFRMVNSLLYAGSETPSRGVFRRVYIKDLASGAIMWDYTYRASDFPGNEYTSPSVHLKINTNYRFYFDDLCNDVDSADRNYSYNNTNNFYISGMAQRMCNGYEMDILHPTDFNTKNRYVNPYDTITIIGSTLAGDTMIGKRVIKNFADVTKSQTLSFRGVTPGNTYTIEVRTMCGAYTKSALLNFPPLLSVTPNINDYACKLNTAGVQLVINNYTVSSDKVRYRINSGPASFTDNNGNVYAITYPVIDSLSSTAGFAMRNFPPGTYSIDYWDACGYMAPVTTVTVGSNDILKLNGMVTVNQQCPGASSITYNNLSTRNMRCGFFFQKKNASGIYATVSSSNYTTATFPSSLTFSALADGEYRILILPYNNGIPTGTYKGPITNASCDTFFNQAITLQYQLPAIKSAEGYVCIPGSNDGKIILHGAKGTSPYEFQRVDGSGNALTAYQPDSLFTGLARGLHNFRIRDNCGNATLAAFSIDTLKPVPVSPNSTCYVPGNDLTLTADTIFSASYSWNYKSFTSGTVVPVSTGRSVTIPSLDDSKWGTYTVTYTTPGCSTAKSTDIVVTNCFVLPVHVLPFTVKLNEYYEPDMSWSVPDEKSIREYEIQYSYDGITWIMAATLPAAHNEASGGNKYAYHIAKKIQGKVYYRLRVEDNDGDYRYSRTISVAGNEIKKLVKVFPNPASDRITISISGYKNTVIGKIFNASGQLLITKELSNGNNVISTDRLYTGNYLLVLDENGKQDVYKFIIAK